MKFTDKTLEEFSQVYQQAYHQPLPKEKAAETLEALLTLLKLTNPKRFQKKNKGKNNKEGDAS